MTYNIKLTIHSFLSKTLSKLKYQLNTKAFNYNFKLDYTYVLEKLYIYKTTKLILKNTYSIKIQENIFYKYIMLLHKQDSYNTHLYKYNILNNLHKYLITKFPKFNYNINLSNKIFLQELVTQINYTKNNIKNQLIIKNLKNFIPNNLKAIEYIFELYSSKFILNLISPTHGFLLNFNSYTQYLYYIEIPLQNLTQNLTTTTLSCTTTSPTFYLKTFNTLVIGGDTLMDDIFSPNLITKYYYNTLISNTNLYIAFKYTSVYMYNIILESLLKQYKYQGIILPSFLFEIIVKRMVCYVKILSNGDTSLFYQDIISGTLINLINQSFNFNGLIGAFYTPTVVGISKISLNHGGLLSSISFQETVKLLSTLVLTNQIDWILDLKAKIILSDLLDTGTGWYKHYNIVTKNF